MTVLTTPRFPAVSARVAESHLTLVPFPGFPHGWSGTFEEFLEAVRTAAIPLENAPLVSVLEEYLLQRERLALDETAEYLHLAAALCDWKARLLLPSDPALGEPDPREQLVTALESELRRVRSGDVAPAERAAPEEIAPAGLSLLDLMVLLHDVEQRATLAAAAEWAEPDITVADQIRWLLGQLPAFAASPTDAATLFAAQPGRRAVHCLFLALLEMGKQGILLLDQAEAFGEIWVTTSCAVPVAGGGSDCS